MSNDKSNRNLRPFLWFTLYEIFSLGAGEKPTKVSTTKLSASMRVSQQSASRHLKLLEQKGLIKRRIESDGGIVTITEEGMNELKTVYHGLTERIESLPDATLIFEGTVFSGMFQGAYYISQGGYKEQIREKMGFDPYLGTLNLRLKNSDIIQRRKLDLLPHLIIKGFSSGDRGFGDVKCYPLLVNDEIDGALIVANRTAYDDSVMEIIAPVNLRRRLDLKDGDVVKVTISGLRRSSSLS